MKRVTTLTVIVLAVAATPANAVTLVRPDGPVAQPYQRWADASFMPTPNVTITIESGRCPPLPEKVACTWRDGPIWVDDAWYADDRLGKRLTFLHEIGHNFDYYILADAHRDKFRALIDDPRPWRPPPDTTQPNSPNEQFAEAYSFCASLGRDARWTGRLGGSGYNYRPTLRRHRRICQLIRRAAATTGG